MFRLWSEWDIGHEDLIFKTEAAAHTWLQKNEYVQEMATDEQMPVDTWVKEIFDTGLFGLILVEIIE